MIEFAIVTAITLVLATIIVSLIKNLVVVAYTILPIVGAIVMFSYVAGMYEKSDDIQKVVTHVIDEADKYDIEKKVQKHIEKIIEEGTEDAD